MRTQSLAILACVLSASCNYNQAFVPSIPDMLGCDAYNVEGLRQEELYEPEVMADIRSQLEAWAVARSDVFWDTYDSYSAAGHDVLSLTIQFEIAEDEPFLLRRYGGMGMSLYTPDGFCPSGLVARYSGNAVVRISGDFGNLVDSVPTQYEIEVHQPFGVYYSGGKNSEEKFDELSEPMKTLVLETIEAYQARRPRPTKRSFNGIAVGIRGFDFVGGYSYFGELVKGGLSAAVVSTEYDNR